MRSIAILAGPMLFWAANSFAAEAPPQAHPHQQKEASGKQAALGETACCCEEMMRHMEMMHEHQGMGGPQGMGMPKSGGEVEKAQPQAEPHSH